MAQDVVGQSHSWHDSTTGRAYAREGLAQIVGWSENKELGDGELQQEWI